MGWEDHHAHRYPANRAQSFSPGRRRGHAAKPRPFRKACARFEEDDFLTATLRLGADGSWERSRIAYEEESCATPWIEFRERARISRREGEELDLTFTGAAYRPLTAEVAEALNISAFCGTAGWKAGEFKEVSGQNCGDYPVPAVNATVYTRVREEQNSLRLAEEGPGRNGRSADRRHEAWEGGVYRPATARTIF